MVASPLQNSVKRYCAVCRDGMMSVGMVLEWLRMVLRLDSKGRSPYAEQGELDGF